MDRILKFGSLIIIFGSILTRLPFIFSNNLFLDGDECVIALMAKHVYEGGETSFFFYGQSYGFSLIEVSFVRLFYFLIGISDIAVKLAMLSLWTIGILFFYKMLKSINTLNKTWGPLLLSLVFITSPTWMLWSMKARGGYLTAFTLSMLFLFFLFNRKYNQSTLLSLILGGLLVLIFQSQPLWIVGLIPIIIYSFFKRQNKKLLIYFLIGCLFTSGLFVIFKLNCSNYWSPRIFQFSNFSFESLLALPQKVFRNLTGFYLLNPSKMSKLYSTIICLTLAFGIVMSFLSLFRNKINSLTFYISLSLIGTILSISFFIGHHPRYLLPLFGNILFLIYLLPKNNRSARITNVFLACLILIGSFSISKLSTDQIEKKSSLISLIHRLDSLDIKHVFCEGSLLQWQIIFYSKERIIARCGSNSDRYPNYPKAVNRAFNSVKDDVGLVGSIDKMDDLSPVDSMNTHKTSPFFIYQNPSKSVLLKRNFEFD